MYAAAADSTVGSSVPSLLVSVDSDDEELQAATDESYALDINAAAGTYTAHAKTVFGAMRAMETFSQLVFKTNSGALYISATPSQPS